MLLYGIHLLLRQRLELPSCVMKVHKFDILYYLVWAMVSWFILALYVWVFSGGARSICVFANDKGNGSISPLIVTGGKSGDVGVHDFRYIATGRPKKHNGEHKFNASSTAGLQIKHGDQNRNGMLWYIPKAHSGTKQYPTLKVAGRLVSIWIMFKRVILEFWCWSKWVRSDLSETTFLYNFNFF